MRLSVEEENNGPSSAAFERPELLAQLPARGPKAFSFRKLFTFQMQGTASDQGTFRKLGYSLLTCVFSSAMVLFSPVLPAPIYGSSSSLVWAQQPRPDEIGRKLQAARNGQMSLEEFGEYLVRVCMMYQQITDYVAGMKFSLSGFPEVFGPIALKHMRLQVARGAVPEASRLVTLGRAFLDEKNPQRDQIEALFLLVQRISLMAGEKDLKGLLELYAQPKEPGLKELIDEGLSASIVRTAEALTADQDPILALRILGTAESAIDSPGLDVLSRKIIREGAQKISEAGYVPPTWTLHEPPVQDLLKKILPQERDAVIALYTWKTIFEIKADNPDEAGRYYNLVIGNRPDPDPANTVFRKEVVLAADAAKAREFAKGRLKELQAAGALTPKDKFTLLMRGYYGTGFLVFFIATMLMVLGCLLVLVVRPKMVASGAKEIADLIQEAFKRKRDEAPEYDDEYCRLLALFGLQDGASEMQIKRAFREAIKQYHPDRQGAIGVLHDSDKQTDATFQELRRAYERIIEIRSGWFGRRK